MSVTSIRILNALGKREILLIKFMKIYNFWWDIIEIPHLL
jgi:hypothetical protein